MAALLYCTGMRIEEVLGLRWEDIDTERGCIHIRRAVVHPGRNMPEIKSTKSKAEQTIPLPRHLFDKLSPKEETGFLLNSYTDLSRETPLSYTEAAKSFKRIQKQCGVEGYTAHDFRDPCATEWRESGISIDLIARLLGHKKTDVTEQIFKDEVWHQKMQKRKPSSFLRNSRVFRGADGRIRTGDLILTKDALYRLSYISIGNE